MLNISWSVEWKRLVQNYFVEDRMKRLMTGCSVLALVSMVGLTGQRTFAAQSQAAMPTVALCSSAPLGVASLHDLAQGIFNGVIMATRVWRPKFAKLHVNLAGPYTYDDARSDGVTYGTDQERQNALKCIGRADTYGYIGTLNSGAAQVSEPLLNQAHMVQISPANTGVALTDPKSRASQEPATFKHQIPNVTYFRTVTTDNVQGEEGAIYLHGSLHVSKYYLLDDKTTYGAGLAQVMDGYAKHHLGMTRVGIGHVDNTDSASLASSSDAIADQVVSTNPDAVYCGCDSENAITLVRDLRSKGFTKPVMAGDAFVNTAYTTLTGRASAQSFATSVGPDISKQQPAFKAQYQKNFPGFFKKPGVQAYDALSWDASNIALKALYEAIKSHNFLHIFSAPKRRELVASLVAKMHYKGATGLTSFDKNGDTTNRIISLYAVKNGTWTFTKQVVVKGVNPV
jgi:branched-chain amino acid transport system substrate-binding protein